MDTVAYNLSELLPNAYISKKSQDELEILLLGKPLYSGTSDCQIPFAKVISVDKDKDTITFKYLEEQNENR